MVGEAATVSRSVWLHPHRKRLSPLSIFASRVYFPVRIRIPPTSFSLRKITIKAAAAASSVGNTEYVEEPATNVKFQTSLTLPGCSTPLSLIGTGFREKVFAIIGVKVYAAGLFVNPNILDNLDEWRGRTAAEIESDSLLFDKIYQAPLEKSLQIILVRDIDGKTFWDALDDAVSPRIKSPNSIDKTALSKFRGIFQHRPLKKGTFIFLTWLHPSKMLVRFTFHGFTLFKFVVICGCFPQF